MDKGIRVKGKEIRRRIVGLNKWDESYRRIDCEAEIELPPVRPEELKKGGTVLVKKKIKKINWLDGAINGIIDDDEQFHFVDDEIVTIIPEEPGAKIPEGKEEMEKVLNSAVKTGIGIASIKSDEFFKIEQKCCENCNRGVDGQRSEMRDIFCGLKVMYHSPNYCCTDWQPKESPQPKEEQPIPACHPDLHLPLEANIIGYARCSKCGNLYKPEGELDFGDLKIHESPSGAFCESEMSRWEKHNKLVDLMESLYKRK